MNNDQNIKDLPEGILVKTKDGYFKIVKEGKLVDYQPSEIMVKEEKLKPAPAKPSISFPAPAKPISPKPYAVNIFYPEDEEEIKAHEEKIQSLEPKPTIHDLDPIVKKIIENNKLTFSDEVLEKRFYKVIESRLLDIRDSLETLELLTRSDKIGGMGYDEFLAKKIMNEVEVETDRIHDLETIRRLREEAEREREKERLIREVPEEMPKPKVPFHPPAEEIKAEVKPLTPEVKLPKPAVSEVKPKMEEPIPIKIKEEIKRPPPTEPEFALPKVLRPEVIEDLRPRVVDIKKPPRLIGPVEELAILTLNDFRKLGSNITESIKKLLEKFSLLEEESIIKKQEGISAWRQSEIYKLYLEMGKESIESGRTIREIINSRDREGKPCLTEEEFYAIVDLNRKLRF